MKKVIILISCLMASVVCFSQNHEIKTYSGSIPKVVNRSGDKYPKNEEKYSYYEDENGNRVRHGSYRAEGSRVLTTDGQKEYTIVSANYSNGVVNGTVKIDNVDQYEQYSLSITTNFKNGIPNGSWTCVKKELGLYRFNINVNIVAANGKIIKLTGDKVVPSEDVHDRALGSFVDGKMEGQWTLCGENFTFHNGILINSQAAKDYAYGNISLDDLEKKGYFAREIQYNDNIREYMVMINGFIREFLNENYNVVADTIEFPYYEWPLVCQQVNVLDDDMFESLLNESGIKETNNPDLLNNPYGIKLWEYSGDLEIYSVLTSSGRHYLTHAQDKIFAPAIKVIEDQKAAEEKEKKRLAEEERLAKQKQAEEERLAKQRQAEEERLAKQRQDMEKQVSEQVTYTFDHIRKLLENTSKLDLKLFGVGTILAVDYDHSRVYDNGFYTNDGSRIGDLLGKALKPFVPFQSYSITSISEDSVTMVFELVGKKKVVSKYEIEISIKNNKLCLNDFDMSKSKKL